MYHRLIVLTVIFLCAGNLNGQVVTTQPPPVGVRPLSPEERAAQQQSRQADESFRGLHDLEIRRVRVSVDGAVLSERIQSIYRKPTKEDLKNLAPNPQLVSRYEKFLRQSNAGIIKLNADASCITDNRVVVASANCLEYNFPGAGTAYSFRTRTYRIPGLADLILQKNVLKTDGVLQQGLMVNLGDVPLEDVSLKTGGLKYLVEFKPTGEKKDVEKFNQELVRGVASDGFIYRLGFYAKENTTFALRSIAYRGTYKRFVEGTIYDEFQFDKRRDVLVVFRVVEIDSAGNVTILWKELKQSESPTLKTSQ